MRTRDISFLICAIAICGCTGPHIIVQSPTELQDIVGGGHYPWVLVSISVTGARPQAVCLEEVDFMAALIAEHRLDGDCDATYWQSVSNVVQAGATSGFRFSSPKALEHIPPPCPPATLRAMRRALSAYSDEQLLRHDFSKEPLPLSLKRSDSELDRRVFAQVLIERNLRPFMGCSDGVFHIQKAKTGSTRLLHATR